MRLVGTTIVEGMARAHANDRPVYRDPGIRSSLELRFELIGPIL